MPFPDITLATQTIHNPSEPRHYMRLRPITSHIRVLRQGQVLAETDKAVRMIEVARDVYDPVTYVPIADISSALSPVPNKTTHCPLKGDAHYFSVAGEDPIAWTYDEPLPFAQELAGLVAFYADQVTVEEIGPNNS